MSLNELISVIMPVRNGSAYIKSAIHSILNQSYEYFELIVIDDGSTDDTPNIVRSIKDSRIRFYLDGKALGITYRLNEGIDYARGKYIARMDADDLSFPRRFEIQLGYLMAHPQVDLVCGKVMVIDKDEQLLGVRRAPEQHKEIVARPERGFQMAHPTFMGKAEWFRKNRYMIRLRCEDQDLLLRTFNESVFANVPEYILGYREIRLEPEKYAEGRGNYLESIVAYYKPNAGSFYKTYMRIKNGIKYMIELSAVKTGLGYSVLRNRHMPPTGEERILWERVIKEIAAARVLI